MTSAVEIQAKLDGLQADLQRLHDFLKGDASSVIHGEDGNYPSLAKLIYDISLIVLNPIIGLDDPIGASLVGTSPEGTVQSKLDLLGAPPAVIPGALYLTNVLSPSEITDVAAQTGNVDLSGKINALLTEADGRRDVRLPNDGRVRCDSSIGRTTNNGSNVFYPGTRLIGGKNLILDTRVNNDALIKLDTTASVHFQDDVVLENLKIRGDMGGTAVARDGIWMRRAVRVKILGVMAEKVSTGLHVAVVINDADSSNQIELDAFDAKNCSKWAVNIDPIAGQNDLSYLTIRNSRFNGCGTNERAAISSITRGSTTTIVTSAPHGFSSGEYVTIYNAGLTLANSLEHYTDVVTVTNSTTYTIARNTTGNPVYTGGATAMRQEPNSGTIRMKSQMGIAGIQTWITESQNVGLLLPYGGGGASYKSGAEWFTVENCHGVPIIVNAVDGFSSRNLDLRNNEAVATSFAMFRLDASQGPVTGVDIDTTTVIAFHPSGSGSQAPHVAFSAQQSDSNGLGTVKIKNTAYKAYDDTNHVRYGGGVFTANQPYIDEEGRVIFEAAPAAPRTIFTTANPTYSPDIRKGKRHIVFLGSGASGTLTIAAPTVTGIQGAALAAQELEVIIVNASGVTVSLAYGLFTMGAPTSVATNVNKSGRWIYDIAMGWIQSAPWL